MKHAYDDLIVKRFNDAICIFESNVGDQQEAAIKKVLASDKENPFAIYVMHQYQDDNEKSTPPLIELACEKLGRKAIDDAISFARANVDIEQDEEDTDTEITRAIAAMMAELASHRYLEGKHEDALSAAMDSMSIDLEGDGLCRTIACAIMIEHAIFKEVIDLVDGDRYETAFTAHCRAIALFETEGPNEESSDALLEAISIDPDMGFTAIGMMEMPDEDDYEQGDIENMDDLFAMSILSDLWGATEDRLTFISSVLFSIAYITGRIEDEEFLSHVEANFKELGCLEDMQEARDVIHARIASGENIETTDDEAILMFRDIRDKGVFHLEN